MNDRIVICDHNFLNASLVPAAWLGPPGGCPPGIYETLLWDDGYIRYWDEHLARLANGCNYAGILFSECGNLFDRSIIELLAAKNNIRRGRYRLRLMAFGRPRPVLLEEKAPVQFVAAFWRVPLLESAGTEFRCSVSSKWRNACDLSYGFKQLARLHVDEDLTVAAAGGFQDVLYFNQHGGLCEASYSNVWVIRGGELFTPPVDSPCLPGIVRAEIIRVAEQQNIKVHVDKPIGSGAIAKAEDVFLSSSIRGIRRIANIDGITSSLHKPESALLRTLREQVKI